MQLLYQTRDAKQDYSAMRKARVAELANMQNAGGYGPAKDDDSYDPEWETAMQTSINSDGDDVDLSASDGASDEHGDRLPQRRLLPLDVHILSL